VVLWLEPDGVAPTSPYELRTPNRLVAAWHYIGIKLYELPAETLLERSLPGLLPLVPFCAGGADLGVIERSAELVQEMVSGGEAEILESLLFVFAARSFDASVLLAMMRRLHMSTEIIEKSAFYQEALVKGVEQGKVEGIRDAAFVTLRGRFGELPPDLLSAISEASSDVVLDVLAHAGTETLEQVRSRLGL
jgi:hypothetical protein